MIESSDSITDANTLWHAITSTDFIASFKSSLQYLHSLTVNLQGSSTDIIHAVKEIKIITTTIQNIRDNIDTYHDQWFTEIKEVCDTAGTVPSTPRTCARRAHRSNTPASSSSEYYLRTISIPLIDHLLSELKSRFSSHQSVALLGLYIIPSGMLVMPVPEFLTHSSQLADKYKDDLPSPASFARER